MSSSTRKLIKATENIANEYGIKYCTKCMLTRPVEGGRIVPIGRGRTRWECSSCVARTKPAGFTIKRRQDEMSAVRREDGVQPDEKLHRPR